MCQLFALSCNVPTAVTFSFTGFSARGGSTGEHADGFGLAFHDGKDCRVFIDDQRASDSALAQFLRNHPIRARQVLAHIRKATQGPVSLANCHPFVRQWQGHHWSFCHNGDLKQYAPRLAGSFVPVGSTDSERALCWILQQLQRRFGAAAAGPRWPQLGPVIAQLAERIAAHGPFNFVLSDGEALYAHCSTRLFWLQRSHPFPTARLIDHDLALDLSVANGPDDKMALVATEPLTSNEDWRPFAPGELQVFVAGERVWGRTARVARVPRVAGPARVAAPRRTAPPVDSCEASRTAVPNG
jgi:predicted glutamine amidotransferase